MGLDMREHKYKESTNVSAGFWQATILRRKVDGCLRCVRPANFHTDTTRNNLYKCFVSFRSIQIITWGVELFINSPFLAEYIII